MRTKPYGNLSKSKVFAIGHDPRLQISNTQAEFCFFADYYFKPPSSQACERGKYNFSKILFDYMMWLTSNHYRPEEFYLTNLCNELLEPSPPNTTVFIPKNIAKEGIDDIVNALSTTSSIEIILAMSQQVNFWLQKLGFYSSSVNYISKSEPNESAMHKGYYKPVGKSPFLEICGKQFNYKNIPLFPILHAKQFPFRKNIKPHYEPLHNNCRERIKKVITNLPNLH